MNKQGRWNLTDSQQSTPQTREGRKEKQNQITLAWGGKETRKGLIKTSREGEASESFQMRKWGGGEDRRVADIFKHFCSIFFASDDIINPPAGLFFNTIDCLRRMHPLKPLSPYHPWRCGLAPPETVPRLSHGPLVGFWEKKSQREMPEDWSWHLLVALIPVLCSLFCSSGMDDLKGSAGLLGRFFISPVSRGKEVGDRHTISWLGIQRKLYFEHFPLPSAHINI